jgi:LCP family protein required for cell wall assembly
MSLPPPPPPPQPIHKRVSLNWIVGILVVGFLAAAVLTAYLAFSVMRSAVFSLRSEFGSPEIAEAETFITPQDIANLINIDTPLQAADGPPPEYWDGQSRVNILFIGVDHRDWMNGQGPPLADTLILATYDPQSQTVGMLSIPRDLWVELPGLGYHKINQSFQLGEATNYPGGGAAMAMETVEELLGVPIHFYVLVDFEAFVRLVDEIGGVKIDVPEKIVVDPLGDHNTEVLKPGIQTLPGDLALAYARSRNTSGSDFDRAERQQQVIMGVRDRVASFEILPTLISRAPALYQELSSRINTNLNVKLIFELAWDIQQIPEERIRRRVISHEQVVLSVSFEGMSILLPIPDEILLLRDEVFSTENQESVSTEVVTDAELIAAEAASISVRNGTMVAGLAARTDYYLQLEGITALEITNADQLHVQTTIVDYTGKPHTTQYLAKLLSAIPGNVYHRYDPASPYDIIVVLGEDWAANNQMP